MPLILDKPKSLPATSTVAYLEAESVTQEKFCNVDTRDSISKLTYSLSKIHRLRTPEKNVFIYEKVYIRFMRR